MEPIYRLVYASVPAPALAETDLRAILASARHHNGRCGITGFLAFNAQGFLQTLEGPRDAVNHTYARILRDHRHSDAVILEYGPVEARAFADWSMGYAAVEAADRACVLRYSSHGRLEARGLSPRGAVPLLRELAQRPRRPLPAAAATAEA